MFYHLHIKVADVQASLEFYREIFGFKEKVKFSEDFLFAQDPAGFDLAIAKAKEPVRALPEGVHFGFCPGTRDAVVEKFQKMKRLYPQFLADDAIQDRGNWGDFNCTDPDGYPIQVYWDEGLHPE